MNIVSSITSSIVSSIIAKSSALIAWFKLLTTDPANSTPTKGATVFSRATGGKAFDANGLLVSYAPNMPRYQNGGLLIEQASTNLFTYSDQFDNAVWIKSGAAITPNAAIAPDGKTTADKITPYATSGDNRIVRRITVGVALRMSIYASPAGYNFLQGWSWAGGNTSSVCFDLANGVISANTLNATMEKQINGFYRCSWDIDAANALVTFRAAPIMGAGQGFITGDSTSGIYIWHAQLETGSKATSPIKTLGAPVTRAADICYTATANIPTLANGATFVWRGALPNDGLIHEAFATSTGYVIVRRHPNRNVTAYVGGILMGGVAGIDTAIRTFSLRTNGSNLHELLIDGVVAIT